MTENNVFSGIVARRTFLAGALGATAVAGLAACGTNQTTGAPDADPGSTAPAGESGAARVNDNGLAFEAIAPDTTDGITLPAGYVFSVLAAWGDPVVAGSPAFDINKMTPEIQSKTFGYNSDYITVLRPEGQQDDSRLLLWNNHEYIDPVLMFPGYDEKAPTADQVNMGIEAHGGSILEIERGEDMTYSVIADSELNRRITGSTAMEFTGPAAGAEALKTSTDPTGTKVNGTLNNCAGGHTPWNTVLVAEENFDRYFEKYADARDGYDAAHQADLDTYELEPGEDKDNSKYLWASQVDRFDLTKEPHEIHRFGWVVEVDPWNPESTPRKHTALGRFKHESATAWTDEKSQRVVVYSGDDQKNEMIYKYVSDGTVTGDAAKDTALLDEGTLHVARFNDDGTGTWIPLVHGEGKLTAPDFADQADVLIRTRSAARAVGATHMDRPEDVEVSPSTGIVYIALTKNADRGEPDKPAVDAANPRPANDYGHLIAIKEDDDSHIGTSFTWELPFLAGHAADAVDPDAVRVGMDTAASLFGNLPAATASEACSDIACPDNLEFDNRNNLWIVTDGMPGAFEDEAGEAGPCDGVFASVVEGEDFGLLKQFMSGVPDSESTGPRFSQDNKTLFVSIQHPGEGSTLEEPTSRFPDQAETGTPRPCVIQIVKEDKGVIGS